MNQIFENMFCPSSIKVSHQGGLNKKLQQLSSSNSWHSSMGFKMEMDKYMAYLKNNLEQHLRKWGIQYAS
jgi:hypothetical protein